LIAVPSSNLVHSGFSDNRLIGSVPKLSEVSIDLRHVHTVVAPVTLECMFPYPGSWPTLGVVITLERSNIKERKRQVLGFVGPLEKTT